MKNSRTTLARALVAFLVAGSSLHARTELHPLELTLSPGAGDDVALTLRNRDDAPVTAVLSVRAADGEVHPAPSEARFELAPGAEVVLPLDWRAASGDRLQARAWPLGSSSFVQARLFEKAGARVDLATLLDEPAPGFLRTQPALTLAEGEGVRGKVLYPAHDGQLLPLARVTVKVGGASTRTDDAGNFVLSGVAAGEASLTVETKGSRWTVRNRSRAYTFQTASFAVPESGAVDLGEIQLPAGEPVTEAAWVHAVAARAERFLETAHGDVSWWDHLPIYWPSNGDYYSWGSLNITEAHRWDVIGHELGHAVYFAASRFSGGGGAHKIDECYSKGLALSEGWATFFSGAIFLERDDPDARFEFLVPRRAPIRLENVPADVCEGPTNEWRVAAAFWDMYDTHADGGDAMALDWDASSFTLMRSGKRIRGMLEALTALESGMDDEGRQALDASARHNKIRGVE